ncbi:unnamed protein product [Mytilus edulis]|uniref:Ig-like domain-containing protein n=1 Tax=Mytilus edulis TaxID=6550 RepID=A0A8S3USG4_MYTED|nr:unnamed protein product [Mytilus edulis]
MPVLIKYLCIDMKTVLVVCILISVMYCEQLFVKKYTSVDIACPFTPMSWYNDQSIMIVVGKDINPNFTSRYGITDTRHLNILNFTVADQGRYMCHGVVDMEFQQHTVIVNMCKKPEKISLDSYPPNKISSTSERKLLCTNDNTQYNDQLSRKAIIRILKLPTSKENIDDKNGNNGKGRLMEYKCMTLNADNCLISKNALQLTVEWISSNKITKETAANTTQHFEYTCECNASNTGENLPCNETMQIYYSNKTVYLRDPDKYAIGSFECVLVENDVSEKTTTPPDIELNSFVQRYTCIGLSVVCGVIFVGVLIWSIRRALNNVKNNADNNARLDESQNCPAEGYSSIDRRRRIEVGQMVSYKASRVSRSSKANESGYGLVSSDGRKGRQPDDLTVPYLKNIISGQNSTETPFLNYIEVEFNTDTVSPKLHIHGSGNKTPYADIDLTLKADHLPESDSSEEEDPDTNSEFMTLDDIQKLDKPSV